MTKHVVPLHGPPMVSDPVIRGGRPTNVNNILFVAAGGTNPGPLLHVVPKNQDWLWLWTPERAASFVTLSADALHDEMLRTTNRGRQPRIDLSAAITAREEYWSGKATMEQLRQQLGYSNVSSVHRLIHGITYWYAS